MRFEELAYRDGGQAVTIPFHRTLTVLGGLDAQARRRFAERAVASLTGTAAGFGVSLVFVDGTGSRVHLVRDQRGVSTVTGYTIAAAYLRRIAPVIGRVLTTIASTSPGAECS